MRSRHVPLLLPILLLLLLAPGADVGWMPIPLLSASHADAQQDGVPERVLHERRPEAGGVAVSIHLPGGTLADPTGAEGTAFLLGRVLEAWGEERLAPLSGRVHVEVTPEATQLTLQAPPTTWVAAWDEVRAMLTADPLPERLVTSARDRLADELTFQAGAPVRDFEARWRSHRLQGLASGGGPDRPPLGTAQSIRALDAAALQAFRQAHLEWAGSTVAVVGSASSGEVATLRGRRLTTLETLPADTGRVTPPPATPDSLAPSPGDPAGGDTVSADAGAEAPLPRGWARVAFPGAPLTGSPPDPNASWRPWVSRDRVLVDQEITSSWIGVAWALPPESSWTLRDFLAHVVRESLNPSPPDPGLYRADVRLEEVDGQPLLVVVATVDPQSAAAWEDRILETLDGVSREPPPGSFFELTRRRYRSHHLLEMADPALRARWLASRASGDRDPPQVVPESWALTREALAGLAGARGEPRILVYGPERMMARPDA